jgi:site-specific DNA-methyltransferase (adenine-specific)
LLPELPKESVDCIVTSPPYFLQRDYGTDGQLGLELTVQDYLNNLCSVFDECRNVLKKSGTLFVVIGDTYSTASGRSKMISGGKSFSETAYSSTCPVRDVPVYRKHVYLSPKDLEDGIAVKPKTALLIPERFAIEMVNRGWILRSKIIWEKTNAIPESVKDRFSVNFENIYFFVKSKKYFFCTQYEPSSQKKWCAQIGGSRGTLGNPNSRSRLNKSSQVAGNKRRVRSVWSANTNNSRSSHHTARFPESIVERCLRAGSP